jgi:hypothetical protein
VAETVTVEQDVEEVAAAELPRWERVECTCPDWCERDHETD